VLPVWIGALSTYTQAQEEKRRSSWKKSEMAMRLNEKKMSKMAKTMNLEYKMALLELQQNIGMDGAATKWRSKYMKKADEMESRIHEESNKMLEIVKASEEELSAFEEGL
jgi:hypothetical protein